MTDCEQSLHGKRRWRPCMCPRARTPPYYYYCYWCYCHPTCSNMDQWWVADMTLSLKNTTWILVGKLITLGPFSLWKTSDSFARKTQIPDMAFPLLPTEPQPQPLSEGLQNACSCCFKLLRCLWLFATPWTAACQAPLSSTSLRVCSSSCPLSWWCYLTICRNPCNVTLDQKTHHPAEEVWDWAHTDGIHWSCHGWSHPEIVSLIECWNSS